MPKCFNGHRRERPGCAGCHHAFHVIEPGKVAAGQLVPPVVKGPDDCELCHEARHVTPVDGCPHCEGRFADMVHQAMTATQDVRSEIWGLRFLKWFVGWQSRLIGWFGLIAGVGLDDWFERPDGSQSWIEPLFAAAAIPVIQWTIRKRIEKREQMLPRLSPKGEIVYGSEPPEIRPEI